MYTDNIQKGVSPSNKCPRYSNPTVNSVIIKIPFTNKKYHNYKENVPTDEFQIFENVKFKRFRKTSKYENSKYFYYHKEKFFYYKKNFTNRVPFVNHQNFQSADDFEMYRGNPNNWNYQGNGYHRQDEFYLSKNYQENHKTHKENSNYRHRYENCRPYSHGQNHHQRHSIRKKHHYNDICEPNFECDEEYNRPSDRYNYHKKSSPRSRRNDSYQNNRRLYPMETIPTKTTKTETNTNITIRDESKCSNRVNNNNIEVIRKESKCCNNIDNKSTVESDQVVPKPESPVILTKNDFFVLEEESEEKTTFDAAKSIELPLHESTIKLTNEIDTKDKINTEEKVIIDSLKETLEEEELELEKLCNDHITIDDIFQSGSYLEHFPLMDDYRVVDMDLGSPVTANKEQSKVTLSTDELLEELEDAMKGNESNKTPTASSPSPLKRRHSDHRRTSIETRATKRINDDEDKIKVRVTKRRKSCVEDNRRSSVLSATAESSEASAKDWKSIYFPSLRNDYTIPKASKSKPVFSRPDTPCSKPIHILFNNEKVDELSSKIVATSGEKEKSSKIVATSVEKEKSSKIVATSVEKEKSSKIVATSVEKEKSSKIVATSVEKEKSSKIVATSVEKEKSSKIVATSVEKEKSSKIVATSVEKEKSSKIVATSVEKEKSSKIVATSVEKEKSSKIVATSVEKEKSSKIVATSVEKEKSSKIVATSVEKEKSSKIVATSVEKEKSSKIVATSVEKEKSSKIVATSVEKEESSKIVKLKEADSKKTITKRQKETKNHGKVSKDTGMIKSPKVEAVKKFNKGSELRKKMQKIFSVRTKKIPVKSFENVDINKIEPKITEGTQKKQNELRKSRFSKDGKDVRKTDGDSSKSVNSKRVSERTSQKTYKSKVESESKPNPKKKLKAIETKKVSPDKNKCSSATEPLPTSEKIGVEINANKGVLEKNKKSCKKLNAFDIKNFVIDNAPNDINVDKNHVKIEKNQKDKKLRVSTLKISLIRKNFNEQLNQIFDDNFEAKDCCYDLDTSMKDVGSREVIEQDSNVQKDNANEVVEELKDSPKNEDAKKDDIIEGVKEFQKLDDDIEDTFKDGDDGYQKNDQQNSSIGAFEENENCAKKDIEEVEEFQKLDEGIEKDDGSQELEEEYSNKEFEGDENGAKKDDIIEGTKKFQKLDDGIGDTSINIDDGHQEYELNLQQNSSIGALEENENCAKKDIEKVEEFQKLDESIDDGSQENEELEEEEFEGDESSMICTQELFDLKDISCEKIEQVKTDHKLKIFSDLEGTSIQLVEFDSGATSPSIIFDLTSPEDDHEAESDVQNFKSEDENIQIVEEKACDSSGGVELNEFGNVCKKLEEIFSLLNPNLNKPDVSDDEKNKNINKVTEKLVKCIKTERNDDKSLEKQLIVIKTPVKSEVEEYIETCKHFMMHQYPTWQKAVPIPIETNCNKKASITETPVVGTVEIVKQVVQNIEIIDLTNEIDDKVESNLCQTFDESTEKITLYRSDETSTGNPDVLAMSASLSPSVILNKKALNIIKNELEEGRNEVDDNKKGQYLNQNFTLKDLLLPTNTNNQTVTATKPVQTTSYAATSSTGVYQIPPGIVNAQQPPFAQDLRTTENKRKSDTTVTNNRTVTATKPVQNTSYAATSSTIPVGVYQIPCNPPAQQPSYAQDLRMTENKRKSVEQREPVPAVCTRSGQFYETAPSMMMEYNERVRQAVQEATTRRQKSNSPQRNNAATIPKTSQPPPPPHISLSEWQRCVSEYIWLLIHKSHVDVKDLSWIKSNNLTPSIYAKELKIVETTNELRFTVYAKELATRLHFTNIVEHSITPVHIVAIYEYIRQKGLPVTLLQTYAVLWKLIGPYHEYYTRQPILKTLYKIVNEVIRAILSKSDVNKSSNSIPAYSFTSNQRDQLLCQIRFYNSLIKKLSAPTMSRPVYYASNDTAYQSKPQNILYKKPAESVVRNNQPQQTTSAPAGRSYTSNPYDHLIYQRINGAVADNQATYNNRATYKSGGNKNQIPDQTNAASYQKEFSNYTAQRPSSNMEYARVPATDPLPHNPSITVNFPQVLDNVPTFKVPSKSNENLRRKTTENNLFESTSSNVTTNNSPPSGPTSFTPKVSSDAPVSFLTNETTQTIPLNQPIPTDKPDKIVNETITKNVEAEASVVQEEEEVIDLTWLDDFKTEELKEAVECIIKKEESICEEDEVILNQEQFPLAYSPSDSGVESSPSPQREVRELVFIGRYCICDKPAEYICGCRMAMYCSNYCQNKDWVEHKKTCFRVLHH